MLNLNKIVSVQNIKNWFTDKFYEFTSAQLAFSARFLVQAVNKEIMFRIEFVDSKDEVKNYLFAVRKNKKNEILFNIIDNEGSLKKDKIKILHNQNLNNNHNTLFALRTIVKKYIPNNDYVAYDLRQEYGDNYEDLTHLIQHLMLEGVISETKDDFRFKYENFTQEVKRNSRQHMSYLIAWYFSGISKPHQNNSFEIKYKTIGIALLLLTGSLSDKLISKSKSENIINKKHLHQVNPSILSSYNNKMPVYHQAIQQISDLSIQTLILWRTMTQSSMTLSYAIPLLINIGKSLAQNIYQMPQALSFYNIAISINETFLLNDVSVSWDYQQSSSEYSFENGTVQGFIKLNGELAGNVPFSAPFKMTSDQFCELDFVPAIEQMQIVTIQQI